MKKNDFKKFKMDGIVFCDVCWKKIVFNSFYKNTTNNVIICKNCYRGLK